jgi:hypothetical protein
LGSIEDTFTLRLCLLWQERLEHFDLLAIYEVEGNVRPKESDLLLS